jgi:hypothetical protein
MDYVVDRILTVFVDERFPLPLKLAPVLRGAFVFPAHISVWLDSIIDRLLFVPLSPSLLLVYKFLKMVAIEL